MSDPLENSRRLFADQPEMIRELDEMVKALQDRDTMIEQFIAIIAERDKTIQAYAEREAQFNALVAEISAKGRCPTCGQVKINMGRSDAQRN